MLLCFWCSQAAPSPWEWNRATSRTTRSLLQVSSGQLTWTCSPGSPGRPGWTNKARSTLGQQDTATSHSGSRYKMASRLWPRLCFDATVVCGKSLGLVLIGAFAVWWDADSASSRYHPWKQSAIGSISLFLFWTWQQFWIAHPRCQCWKSLALLCLAAAQPLHHCEQQPIHLFVSQSTDGWKEVLEKALLQVAVYAPVFLFFFTVNMWD